MLVGGLLEELRLVFAKVVGFGAYLLPELEAFRSGETIRPRASMG